MKMLHNSIKDEIPLTKLTVNSSNIKIKNIYMIACIQKTVGTGLLITYVKLKDKLSGNQYSRII